MIQARPARVTYYEIKGIIYKEEDNPPNLKVCGSPRNDIQFFFLKKTLRKNYLPTYQRMDPGMATRIINDIVAIALQLLWTPLPKEGSVYIRAW